MKKRSAHAEGVTELPMVPLRDIVVFPHTMVPFVVGRPSSLLAVERGAQQIVDPAAPAQRPQYQLGAQRALAPFHPAGQGA